MPHIDGCNRENLVIKKKKECSDSDNIKIQEVNYSTCVAWYQMTHGLVPVKSLEAGD